MKKVWAAAAMALSLGGCAKILPFLGLDQPELNISRPAASNPEKDAAISAFRTKNDVCGTSYRSHDMVAAYYDGIAPDKTRSIAFTASVDANRTLHYSVWQNINGSVTARIVSPDMSVDQAEDTYLAKEMEQSGPDIQQRMVKYASHVLFATCAYQ